MGYAMPGSPRPAWPRAPRQSRLRTLPSSSNSSGGKLKGAAQVYQSLLRLGYLCTTTHGRMRCSKSRPTPAMTDDRQRRITFAPKNHRKMLLRISALLRLAACIALTVVLTDAAVFRSGLYAYWINFDSTAGSTVSNIMAI